MRRVREWTLALGAVLVAACGTGDEQGSPMAGMSAEEHARMMAGGTQGTMDSTGQAVRQAVHLSPEQERALGVTYTTVRRGPLTRTIRTVGRIEAPEPGIADITPKIDGFVEDLFVTYTGESVRRGQPLLAVYSPMMVAAQEELLTASRMLTQVDASAGEAWRSANAMLGAARRRLEYWDITSEQIAQIEERGEVSRTLTLVAPFNGIVLEKDVLEGQYVMAGQRLYRIADLSEVWVEGAVFEQDLQFVSVGMPAHIEVAAYPGDHVMGRVSFVHPTVDAQSRTNRVRVTVRNPGLRLKPGMYATLFFDTRIGVDLLTVPMGAVVVTGTRNVVFVRTEDGMLAPREVTLGARAGDRVQIIAGLSDGETIVASANFLVDAESRLGVGRGAMAGMDHGTPPPQDSAPPATEHRHD